jgi:hypothetical protein
LTKTGGLPNFFDQQQREPKMPIEIRAARSGNWARSATSVFLALSLAIASPGGFPTASSQWAYADEVTPKVELITEAGECASGCLFDTIQAALDAARSGDIVSVPAGTFAGGITMGFEGVTLQGAGRDETVILSASAYSSSNRGISILAGVGNLRILDLTVDGGPDATFQDGIWWEGGGDNTVIERVAVRNIDRRGISVFPPQLTNTTVRDVVIDNVTGTNSGISAGGLALVFNSAGTIENATITRAKTGVTGTVDAGADHPLNVSGVHVSDFTGIGSTFFNLGLSFNTFPSRAPVMTITNNTVIADVPRNSGLYLVAPGPGSRVANNYFLLRGDLGYGIETGWSPAGGVTIENNVIVSSRGAVGILTTGSGSAESPIVIRNNSLKNLSTAGAQVVDLRNWGILDGREVGVLVSADATSSRTGDAFYDTNALITGNTVLGYTHALAFLADDAESPKQLTVIAEGNRLSATGKTAIYVKQPGTARDPKTMEPVMPIERQLSPIDVSGNFWFSEDTEGWLYRDPVLDLTEADLASGAAPTLAPARTTSDLGPLLTLLDVNPQLVAETFVGAQLSSLSAGSSLSGSLPWANASDQRVDVWGFSEPVLLATGVPVVDGEVVLDGLGLSDLGTGDHIIVLVGQTTGTISALPITILSVATPSEFSGPLLRLVTSGPASPGAELIFEGERLEQIERISVDGRSVEFAIAADGRLSLMLPRELEPGVYDLVVSGGFGALRVQGAITVTDRSAAAPAGRAWTKMRPSGDSVNVYFKNVVGVGKVQFKLNDREIAWVRAIDEADPKIRFRGNAHYLVRTVQLQSGKNIFEIYVEGERVRRTAYTFIG